MHQFQLEQLVRKLDARATRLEQLLPTLATKADVLESQRHMTMLMASMRDDVRTLAAHVLAFRTDVDQRFNRRGPAAGQGGDPAGSG